MRTPGHDEELALGFLYGEGLIDAARAPGRPHDLAANTIEVAGPLRATPARAAASTPPRSCGVCGKGALEEVAVHAPPARPGPRVPRALLAVLPDRLRAAGLRPHRRPARDGPFRRRRGAAARARGRRAPQRDGQGDRLRAARRASYRCTDRILCVSGRLSFELVQKAAVAGAPILVGVGAPSSLAVELAVAQGMTLAGFARRGRVNVTPTCGRVAAPDRLSAQRRRRSHDRPARRLAHAPVPTAPARRGGRRTRSTLQSRETAPRADPHLAGRRVPDRPARLWHLDAVGQQDARHAGARRPAPASRPARAMRAPVLRRQRASARCARCAERSCC